MGALIFLFLGLFVFLLIRQSRAKSRGKRIARKKLKLLASRYSFPASFIFADALGTGIAIDTAGSKFSLFERKSAPMIFDYSKLVSVEVTSNGNTIQTTNRGSQVAGAAVGAVLLGPLGLLVGAVTGSKKQRQKIHKLSIVVYVNDLAKPHYELIFFDDRKGAYQDDRSVTNAMKEVNLWNGRLKAILHGNTRIGISGDMPVSAA